MQYNRPFIGNGGTARSHFFASSESNIDIPGHHLVSAADKFVNSNGQTVVLFRTSRAVAWTDAMGLFPRGVIVTICKGPNASLDEAMFNLMLKALITLYSRCTFIFRVRVRPSGPRAKMPAQHVSERSR